MKAGLIGCGDYLRWEIEELNKSQFFKVKYTFDLDREKSRRISEKIAATPADTVDKIFSDPEIEIVMIYTPPWIREDFFSKAVYNNKHIITTKPLASNMAAAEKLFDIVNGKVKCAVFYGRSGNASVETLKEILRSGEIGKLSLYKEDWLHHYPLWNDWATDPEKNGGPFMDAMIHNLNKSKYLIDSPVKSLNFFSDNYSQSLKCNDTEFMKINFVNGASSYLFITWAADLEVFDEKGNDRVHFGILHQITDQGWYLTEEEINGKPSIKAVKEKEVKIWEIKPLKYTRYDQFCVDLLEGRNPALDIAEALEDIKIWEYALRNKTSASPY
jgi:predicted dehydrogenase